MKKDIRAFKIDPIDGNQFEPIELPEEINKKMDDAHKGYTQPEVFLEKFIGKENFQKADKELRRLLEDSLPEKTKKDCKYCLGKSDKETDKNCFIYEMQAFITFKIMAVEFVDIIRFNRQVFNDKKVRFQLTQEFFNCIRFYNDKGLLAFDMGRMMEKVLEMGLLSVSQMLTKTSHLSKSLRIINHSIDSLNQDVLPYKINGKEVPEFYSLQQDFFKNKQEFYKEEERLNREEKLLKAKAYNQNGSKERPYSTDIAYFCYYTSESKELIIENHFPSKKAWKEIGVIFSKDDTNIQKAYNRIYGNKEERLKHSKITNMNYVIDNMLDDYPKAKKLALEELQLAKIN